VSMVEGQCADVVVRGYIGGDYNIDEDVEGAVGNAGGLLGDCEPNIYVDVSFDDVAGVGLDYSSNAALMYATMTVRTTSSGESRTRGADQKYNQYSEPEEIARRCALHKAMER